MRPRSIRLKNFACFRGEHHIDFANLNSDLFAISGPTGSGKSTLLDAITWALYGATPRLKSQPNAHLLTPGETDLAVVLEFSAGGKEYRATRSLRRRPSGIAPSAKLERLADSGQWLSLPETDKINEYEAALRNILGLDYDSYVRAVMLPQNEFDRFLRGDDKERRDVIKALLKAHTIQKVRDLAASEEREVKQELGEHRARIDNEYEGVTPERAQQLAADIKQQQADLEQARATLKDEQTQLGELERLKEADADLRAALAELEAVDAEQADVEANKAALERAQAAQALAPAIKGYRSREEELGKAKRALNDAETAAGEAEGELNAAKAAFEQASRARSENEPRLKSRLEQIERGRRDANLLAKHKGSVDLADEADGEEFDEDNLADLLQLGARLGELRQLERAAATAEKTLADKQRELAGHGENLQKLEAKLAEIIERGKAAKASADTAKQALEEARVSNAALALRQHLHEGDACPVCSNTVTTLPEGGEDVDLSALEQAVITAEKTVDGIREQGQNVQAQIRAEKIASKQLERAIAEQHQSDLATAQRELSETLEAFTGLGGDSTAITQALQAKQRAQLARLAKRLTAVTGGRDFEELVGETERQLQELGKAVEDAQARLSGAQAAQAGATATLKAARDAESGCRDALAAAEGDLNEALGRSQFDGIEAAESAILDANETQRLRDSIEAHQQRRTRATTKQDAAEKALGGRTYDPEAHRALQEQAAAREQSITADSERVAKAQQQLDDLTERLKSLSGLREKVEKLEERLTVLSNLTLSLQSNRFEAYVLGHALADLAANASVIIHDLTEGRYELNYDDEFYVRDTWLDSHQRSAKTLSGGESFIVSLALALALADTVAGQQNLGALFLDEGFGTLDAESLDSVTEVLTNLTSSGRMVGVITHVTSLTERLPARLVIAKGQRGSRAAWDA